jgi:hypothetical protein
MPIVPRPRRPVEQVVVNRGRGAWPSEQGEVRARGRGDHRGTDGVRPTHDPKDRSRVAK